jgi:outer membrane protein TolC
MKTRNGRRSATPSFLVQAAFARRAMPVLGSLAVMAATVVVVGCASPFADKRDGDLRRAVRISSERELAEARESPEQQRVERENRVEQLNLKPEILDQLEKIAGPASYAGQDLPLGPNLYGKAQKVVRVTLERSVTSGVRHNLNVEFARLAPAVSQQQYVAADAAFDWVLFATTQYNSTNQPRTQNSLSGITTDEREIWDSTVGLRKPLIAGGTFTVQSEFQNTATKTDNLTTSPNPAREANFVIQLDQPLLRGFGSDNAMSQVRLARNGELDAIAQLKSTLLQNVNDTETAYWTLVRSRWDLAILLRLLTRGEEVLGTLRSRKEYDARPATISNAASAVESRRADVIRGQRVLRDASDRLKVLMNDPEFPIGSETLLLPADGPIDQAVEFSLVDAINAALGARPEIQRALLSLDNTSIRQIVAENGRLPRLDLRALTRFNGLGNHIGTPYSQLGEARFVDYQVGLNFEMPLGNRAAEALYRQRGHERVQATIAYRNTIQGIVADVKTSLRDVQANYKLIDATRSSRIAAAEDVRSLDVELTTTGTLDPQNLNLKLQRQQALAAAEQQEISALVDYNTALARLYTATGTSLQRNKIQFSVPNSRVDRRTSDLFPDFPLEPERPTAEEILKK